MKKCRKCGKKHTIAGLVVAIGGIVFAVLPIIITNVMQENKIMLFSLILFAILTQGIAVGAWMGKIHLQPGAGGGG